MVISGTTGIDLSGLPINNSGNTEVEGNLNLSGVGARITGDFSNATVSNRTIFQTSTANSGTGVYFIPNVLSGSAAVRVTNSNDTVNFNSLEINANPTTTSITSNFAGTASALPLTFITNNAEKMRIDTAGNVGIGTTEVYGKLSISGQVGINCGSTQTLSARGIQFFIDGVKHGNLSVDNYDNLLYIGNGLGYGTGSGGTVTQLTSKSTAVTLNKPSGQITMNNSALAAGASTSFRVNNTLVSPYDTVSLSFYGNVSNVDQNYSMEKSLGYGVFVISLKNITGGSLSEAVTINFTVTKGANS